MNLSVVIPNYNGEELLGKNLPKVLSSVEDAEIIVVDDASSDGSLKVLGNFKHKIKIIKNEKNLGFSSTVNRGVKEAKGGIVILLNTDVIPEKGFLDPLLSHFKDDNVFDAQLEELQRKYKNWYYATAYRYKLPTSRIIPFILRLIQN